MVNENVCVVCGDVIPEGMMVCPVCGGELEKREEDRIADEKLLYMSALGMNSNKSMHSKSPISNLSALAQSYLLLKF